jgi:hypothetical protein
MHRSLTCSFLIIRLVNTITFHYNKFVNRYDRTRVNVVKYTLVKIKCQRRNLTVAKFCAIFTVASIHFISLPALYECLILMMSLIYLYFQQFIIINLLFLLSCH